MIINGMKSNNQILSEIKKHLDFIQVENNKIESKLNGFDNRKLLVEKSIEDFKNYITKKEEKLEYEEAKLSNEIEVLTTKYENKINALETIIKEKSKGQPWLSRAIADFHYYYDIKIAEFLELKNHPALKKADKLKTIADEKRQLISENRILHNYIDYYEALFPWLSEYRDSDLSDLLECLSETEIDVDKDPVLKYIPEQEYNSLTTTNRNQKALDRYKLSRKTPWQIGKEYERFIGYKYEQEGYNVTYYGIEQGLEDLGRDLICTKGSSIDIVQCKFWSTHKLIHEKHINQLFGTAVQYAIENNLIKGNTQQTLFPELSSGVNMVFITSTNLSETAKKFAKVLNVQARENIKLSEYPMIKCNISKQGEKIYHLPFDQQYDKIIMTKKESFYMNTVLEAEEMGFRRAFRWTGNK